MHTRYRQLAIAVGGLISILLLIYILNRQFKNTQKVLPVIPILQPSPHASLFFDPGEIAIDSASTTSAHISDIFFLSSIPLANIQIELLYDPQIIKVLSLSSPTSDESVNKNSRATLNTIDQAQGRASFISTIQPHTATQGKILHISFLAHRSDSTTSAEIMFLPKSIGIAQSSDTSIPTTLQNLHIIFK